MKFPNNVAVLFKSLSLAYVAAGIDLKPAKHYKEILRRYPDNEEFRDKPEVCSNVTG